MKNNSYWKKRMELLEESQMYKGEKYLQDLDREYRTVTTNIEREITRWYNRFAINNEITMTEAKKLLNSKELAEFKWDVNEYIKFGERNASNQLWMKQLENASAKVHISRLEALKIQMQQQVEVLYGNQVDGVDNLMRKIYSDGYYHTAFEIQKGFNIGWDLQSLNKDKLDKILSRPWSADGKTFSEKLWKNQQELVGNLQGYLTQSVITGRSPDEIIKHIAKTMGTYDEKPRAALYKAGRLVMTESAAFASAAQKDAFNDLDVEKYEIVATLDGKTSEICQEADGWDPIPMKDFAVGITAPPFHPWCRTTTVPYFDDNYGERAARGADGKTYYVPSDMKYKDWKEKFVDGGSKEDLKPINMFVPASTVEEAQAYALKFAEKVNYGKMSLEHMNEVNRTLDGLFSDKVPRMKLIEMRPSSYKGFKGGAMASYNFVYNEMYLNSAVLKDTKSMGKFITKITQSAKVIDSIDMKDLHKYTAKQADFIRKYKSIGRELVDGSSVKGIITHEFGHHIDYTYFNKKYDHKSYLSGYISKGEKISVYASEQPREYFAEAYVSYMNGELDRLSDDITKMFDEIYK